MSYHLRTVHKITDEKPPSPVPEAAAQVQEGARKRQKTLHDMNFLTRATLEEEVAKMAAKSNFSFNSIATDSFIRRSLARDYPSRTIPKDHHGMARLTMKFYRSAAADVTAQIEKLKAAGTKFSCTLDEWTSCGNKRFMNINLHFKSTPEGGTSFYNLGLFHIEGECPAPTMFKLVNYLILFHSSILTNCQRNSGQE